MGLYIKGMEMPKNCDRCFIKPGYCPAIIDRMKSDVPGYTWIPANYRHEDCLLVEVIEPHGRLIDADALLKDAEVPAILYPYKRRDIEIHTHAVALGDVMIAPTVIPASDEVET